MDDLVQSAYDAMAAVLDGGLDAEEAKALELMAEVATREVAARVEAMCELASEEWKAGTKEEMDILEYAIEELESELDELRRGSE